jgi:hypothetical protein
MYKSDDYGAPVLNGLTGSLLSVLNACLVTGYGNKRPAGWLKPFSDTSSSIGPATIGGFTLPSGSKLNLFVNDSGYPTGAAGTEATIVGWEVLTNASGSLTGSLPASLTASLGGGAAQFPSPLFSQQLVSGANPWCATGGRLVWRKSVAATAQTRTWIVMADAYTVYLFVLTGDTAGRWMGGTFGDIFSTGGISDKYRCHIVGRTFDNTNYTGLGGVYDNIDGFAATNWGGSWNHNLVTSMPGNIIARNQGGGQSSVLCGKTTDLIKMSSYGNSYLMTYTGTLATPNHPDMGYYVAPVWIVNLSNTTLRGKWRGFWVVCHPIGSFTDGQQFFGTGLHAGRKFQIFKDGPNGGFWAMEISPTVETN